MASRRKAARQVVDSKGAVDNSVLWGGQSQAPAGSTETLALSLYASAVDRRRAAIEGWRRSDFLPTRLAPPPAWMAAPHTREEEMEIDPALEEVAAEASTARFGLLFNPDPQGLRRYAFRQASENAAVDRPQQALAWMRLVQLAERCGTRLAMDSSAFSDIDRVRASYLHRLAEEFAAGREDALAEKASDIQPPPPP